MIYPIQFSLYLWSCLASFSLLIIFQCISTEKYSRTDALLFQEKVYLDMTTTLQISMMGKQVILKDKQQNFTMSLFSGLSDFKQILPTCLILIVTLLITVTVIPYAFSSVIKQGAIQQILPSQLTQILCIELHRISIAFVIVENL